MQDINKRPCKLKIIDLIIYSNCMDEPKFIEELSIKHKVDTKIIYAMLLKLAIQENNMRAAVKILGKNRGNILTHTGNIYDSPITELLLWGNYVIYTLIQKYIDKYITNNDKVECTNDKVECTNEQLDSILTSIEYPQLDQLHQKNKYQKLLYSLYTNTEEFESLLDDLFID